MNFLRFTLVVMMLIIAGACRSGIKEFGPSNEIQIQAVYQDQQCPDYLPGIKPIRDTEALADWWQPIASRQYPAKTLPQLLGAIDFEQSAVFSISMGQQPSSGYGIELNKNLTTVQEGSLSIPVNWQKPSPNIMVAQIITNPCIIITVPAGDYRTVTVRDQHGYIVLEAHF